MSTSFKSSISRGFLDLEGFSDEPLDYEPEGIECGEELIDVIDEEDTPQDSPKPSGQVYQDSGTQNGSSFEDEVSELEKVLASNTVNYRSHLNYHNMHFGEKGSWRSCYSLYSEGSQSCRLDSDEEVEEEEDPELSDAVETSFEISADEVDTNNTLYLSKTILKDENGLVPESPTQLESPIVQSHDQTSDDHLNQRTISQQNGLIKSPPSCVLTVKNDLLNQKQQSGQVMPARKPPPLVVSFQSIGQRQVNSTLTKPKRIVPPKKIVKNLTPWHIQASRLMKVMHVSSDDWMVKFIPPTKSPLNDGLSKNSRNSEDSSLPSLFKTPLKRPPTRQKIKGLSVSVNVGSGQKETITVRNGSASVASVCEEHIDDTISLIANTTIGDDDGRDNFASFENIVKDEPETGSASPTETEGYRAQRLNNWLDFQGDDGYQRVGIRIDYVPTIWRGLCFDYCFNDNCQQLYTCKHSHVPATKIATIRRLSEAELLDAYKFAKDVPAFFKKIYTVFAKVFSERDMKNKLIDMVRVIFEEFLNTADQIEGLTVVLEDLAQTDLATFNETVEYLLLQVGLQAYPTLGNVLLEVISVKPELPQFWPVIKRLIITGEKMSVKLGSTFLANLMRSPVDVKVCKDMYQHILKYKCLDLTRVNSEIMQPFLRICTENSGSFDPCLDARIEKNLFRERINFEKEKGNSQPNVLEIDFSKPPPNFTGFKRPQVHQFGRPVQFQPSFDIQNITRLSAGENFFPLRNSNQGDTQQPRLFADDVENNPLAKSQTTTRISARENFDLFPLRNSNHGDTHQSRLLARDATDCSLTESVSDGVSFTNDLLSDADSSEPLFPRKRPATDFQYNRTGLQYDPADDYLPPVPKRPLRAGTEFDRLKEGVTTNKGQLAAPTEEQYDPAFCEMQLRSTSREALVRDSGARVVQISGGARNDGAVSSSSDARLTEQKPPEHPQFGKLYFDPNYEFNKSLHNLYLPKIDNVDMDIEDVRNLNDCVKTGNGKVFLKLVEKYKEPPTVQNFISMTLAHLKGMNQIIATTYEDLLQSIEKASPNFYGNLNVRVILEVITMNLLFELEARTMFKEATNCLCKFSNWDSLVTSRLFINSSGKEVSIIGRYLFIAKILTWTKPELTYEILLCPTLHLLDSYYNWPYHPPCPNLIISAADLEARNIVLTNFLKQGYLLNIVAVIDLYKMAFRKKIWKFEVQWFVDPMVASLIHKGQIVSLKHIYSEFELFVKHFTKYTLRAFLVTMYPYLPTGDLYIIYDKCVEKNIYPRLFKNEVMNYLVVIKTNMLECEIELIVQYFFNKLVELKNLPSGDDCLNFEIQLPGEDNYTQKFSILNANKSLVQTKELLTQALYKFPRIQGRTSTSHCLLAVDKLELINYLETLWT